MTTPTLLEDQIQLNEAFEASHQKPVLIFKHSLICGVSTAAMGAYGQFLRSQADASAVFALVEIQNARDVSDAIAQRTGVRHESPQALLLKDGAVVWHASHGEITPQALTSALDRAEA